MRADSMAPFKHNALLCLKCLKVLCSFYRHHYLTCGCDNEASVDGGFDYFNYGAKDMQMVRHVYLLSIEPKKAIRKVAAKRRKKK
jgi:hypothetical protein